MTRTAIFGGTFNPLHNGHIAVAKGVLEAGLADELWLMVTPQNPWKRNMALMDDNLRFRMAFEATKDIPGIKASDFEFSLPKPSYTAETLRKLSATYPDRQFSLVIGADNWAKFNNWYDYGFILENYPITVYPRDGYPISGIKYGNVHILDCQKIDISSTEIRSRISAGLPIGNLVPKEVEELLGLNKTDSIS